MDELKDHDLETLESYLDQELSPPQVEAVDQRLQREPELIAALDHLRAERAFRRDYWQAMANDPAADRIIKTLASPVRGQRRRQRVWRLLRPAAAIAAAVLLFLGGWFGHGRLATPAGPGNGPVQAVTAYQVTLRDQWGNSVVQRFDSLDQANAFLADLRRWQQRQDQIHNGQIVVVSDRF